MGASLVVRTHPHTGRETIKAWVKEISDTNDVEDGRCYSGQWNMCHGVAFDESRVFDTEDDAETFISDTAIKGESLLAVPAKVQKALSKAGAADEKLAELRTQLGMLQMELGGQSSRIVARAKQAKSELKACKHCSSRVSLVHVHSTQCPVCGGNLLMTDTDEKQKVALGVKREALQARIDKRIEQLVRKENPGTDTAQLLWVVGGWCAS